MDRLDDDTAVERVLRWAVIEQGTAGLSDALGARVICPHPPSFFSPPGVALAGKVQVFARRRPPEGAKPASSFLLLRRAIVPGAIALVQCDESIGAAFGSNVVLQAAACRAQAIITDGSWRDTSRIAAVGLAAGSNGAVPTRPAGCPIVATGQEDMFGVTWRDGDWLLRDVDGVLRLDVDEARRVATEIATSAMGELAALLDQGTTDDGTTV